MNKHARCNKFAGPGVWAAGAIAVLLTLMPMVVSAYNLWMYPDYDVVMGDKGTITSPTNVPPFPGTQPIVAGAAPINVIAAPAAGFAFDSWAASGDPAAQVIPSNVANAWLTYAGTNTIWVVARFKRPAVRLTIACTNRYDGAIVGDPQPFSGSILTNYGATIRASVTTPWPWPPPTPPADQRYKCLGWTATGSAPTNGAGSIIPDFQITNDTTIVWRWDTEHYLAINHIGAGIVTTTNGVNEPGGYIRNGVTATLTASSLGEPFIAWGDAVVLVTRNVLMDSAKSFYAIFGTGSADGDLLPDYWEKAYFGCLDQLESEDPDNDGLNNLQEYIYTLMTITNTTFAYNPANADSDGDGMDDGYEYWRIRTPVTNAPPTPFSGMAMNTNAPVMAIGPYGRSGNTDFDYYWDTINGYERLYQPLVNYEEYVGPDGIVPGTWPATVVPRVTNLVYRYTPNPADTGDQSYSDTTDSDQDGRGDGFDDGFEYWWDKWQQAHQGEPICNTNAANPYYWPELLTNTVPAWPAERRFNPQARHPLDMGSLFASGQPDYDRWFNQVSGQPGDYYTDTDECRASLFAEGTGTLYAVARLYQPPDRRGWCSNPFMWDTDGDGMPDGWEISFGYDPWRANSDLDPAGINDGDDNPDQDWYARAGSLKHYAVYTNFGFHPLTGYGWEIVVGAAGPNTVQYINREEFIGIGTIATIIYLTDTNSAPTHPRKIDTDGDGIWDGWESYMGLDARNPLDANTESPPGIGDRTKHHELVGIEWDIGGPDGLTPFEEFHSFNTSTNIYSARFYPTNWMNKLWPTDVYDFDTDGDQLFDGAERVAFNYLAGPGTAFPVVDTNSGTITYIHFAGNGLNPTTADTDGDWLSDFWEASYPGSGIDTNGDPIGDGMQGDISDAFADYDGDGLVSYQEYMAGAVYHWQYALNIAYDFRMPPGIGWWYGGAWGDYDPYDFFDPGRSMHDPDFPEGDAMWYNGGRGCKPWDPHFWVFWSPLKQVPFRFLTANEPPGPAILPPPIQWGTASTFSTCAPNDPDTDGDAMDDYWECYHGLNPIWGVHNLVDIKIRGGEAPNSDWSLVVGDIRLFPWLNGSCAMDWDQDGLPNIFESIQANAEPPEYYHTDPSPFWITDISFPESWPNLYYWTGFVFGSAGWWYWDGPVLAGTDIAPRYFYTFECNEGMDADNDNLSDRAELVDTTESAGSTDPISCEDPIKRRCMYFNGLAAARTFFAHAHGLAQFRNFAVECWARPQNPATGADQCLVERPGVTPNGNPLAPGDIRANFRLGIDGQGLPFIAYNGAGHDILAVAKAPVEQRMVANQWYHLAGVYDGTNDELRLYINGQLAAMTPSAEIPWNGYYAGWPDNPVPPDGAVIQAMPIVVGAREFNTIAWTWGVRIVFPPIPLLPWPGNNRDPQFPTLGNYFSGYIDEVRIWDSARTEGEIRANRMKHFRRTDIEAINGLAGNPLSRSPLVYDFSFDDVPDPDHNTVVPRPFEQSVGYPIDPNPYEYIPGWAWLPSTTLRYTDYRYIPFIENMVSHLALDPPRDTRFIPWMSATNWYPNTANPYTLEYRHGAAFRLESHPLYVTPPPWPSGLCYGDLLPLRWAVAEEDIAMWDKGGAPATDPFDTDGDAMPDDWETAHGLDPLDNANNNGPDGDNDGDGLSNFYEYLTGNDPHSRDTDGDGVPDGDEDYDGDGLSNLDELRIGSFPNMVDTDDDGVTDWEEVTGCTDWAYDAVRPATSRRPNLITSPLDPLEPIIPRSMFFDGNARLVVPPQNKLMATDWTAEMWVNPATNCAGGALLSRYLTGILPGEYGINYEVGLRTNACAPGQLRPYGRYLTAAGVDTRVDGTGPTEITAGLRPIVISNGVWSHVAATFDSSSNLMCVYVNGELAAYRTDATEQAPEVFGYFVDHWGDEVTIGAARSSGAVADGFKGYLDEVRFWRNARTAAQIWDRYNAPEAVPTRFPTNVVHLKNGIIALSQGLTGDLAAVPRDQKVHALVRFAAEPTSADQVVVEAAGGRMVNYVSKAVRVVAASPGQFSAMGDRVKWSGLLRAGDKIAAELSVDGTHAERDVLLQFYPDVALNEALQAVQAVGASAYQNRFLVARYMVVTASDKQVMDLAADDRLAWMMPSAPFLTSGQPVYCFDDDTGAGGLAMAPFATMGVGWDGPGLGSADLNYNFANDTAALPPGDARQACRNAMNTWAGSAALTFSEIPSAGQSFSIDMGWYTSATDPMGIFDGPGGVLAYAFYPNDINPEPIAGDMNIDDDETWTTTGAGGIDLETVVLHELGHSLGMDHSAVPGAIMFPFYSGVNRGLAADDIQGIQTLYGRPILNVGGAAEFRFDDGGVTAQDFGVPGDWSNNWSSAAILDRAVFSTNTTPPLDKDTDGDGMPDWWEMGHGLNPYVGTGGDGAYGDPDNDGLANLYEYFAGTAPKDRDSDDNGFIDYDSWAGTVYRTYGEIYTDMDGMPDFWEVMYDLDPGLDDSALDKDNDGWSNYAEYMANTDPANPTNYPTPILSGRYQYDGLAQGTFVARVYQTAMMDGNPCAVDITLGPNNTFSIGSTGVLSQGTTTYLKEGDVYIFGFIDADGDGDWTGPTPTTPGEPCGFLQDQPFRLRWGNVPDLVVPINDQHLVPWYQRFDWPLTQLPEYQVKVYQGSGGPLLFTRTLRGRKYFHDWDYQQLGLSSYYYGMPGGSVPSGASYEWRALDPNAAPGTVLDQGMFTIYPAVPAVPQLTSPIGGAEVIHATTEMRWSCTNKATGFRVRVGPVGGGWTIDTSFVAPWRSWNGDYAKAFPTIFGDNAWTNGNYRWSMCSLIPSGSSAWSPESRFYLNLQPPLQGAQAISGDTVYFGKANGTNNVTNIVVQAFTSSGFSGTPIAQVRLPYLCQTNPPAYQVRDYDLLGLVPAAFYVRAFIDKNGNGLCDTWEPQGFAEDYEFRPRPISVATNVHALDVRIIIRDRDTDSDGLPDGWEWHYFSSLQYGAFDDYDSDGLNNLEEYVNSFFDSDPSTADSDGDGIRDGDEVAMGLNPNNPDTDGDGLLDGAEIALGTDPKRRDTDNDGLTDGDEVAIGTNPLAPDTDGDGAKDAEEIVAGTNPVDEGDVLAVTDMGLLSELKQSGILGLRWQGKSGRKYWVQKSGDLQGWQDATNGFFRGDGTHTYTNTVTQGDREYFHIRVTYP